MKAPFRTVRFGPRATRLDQRPDGSMLLTSKQALHAYPARLTERLEHWASVAPRRRFVAQRDSAGHWRSLDYGQTLQSVRSIGQALLDRGLSAERPLAILSDNSIEHLLLALAAQYVGIPFSPVSSAYSLVSDDFGKLRHVLARLEPGLIFAQHGPRFARAISQAVPDECEVVVAVGAADLAGATDFAALLATRAGPAVDEACASVGPDTIAKILFTSGSTGLPKGVINTQRMLCANQQQIAQAFPFLQDDPPVLVDWLVWNHTFGGNHNVGLVLYNGGTLYIDEGKPVAGGIERTVDNLRDVAPTLYFNVPKGFEELVPHLERDPALRSHFFSRLQMIFYAGAGLPQHVWDALDRLSIEATGYRTPITTGLGCTESGPSALFAHWAGGRSGLLGVPVAGLQLALVPSADKLEARYRGPNVTPGYWRDAAATAAAFDDEGYYRTGDALKFAEPGKPDEGLLFDGRTAEDFKLLTGTWVSVGSLRSALVAAGDGLIQDVVITGHDRNDLGAILFPNVSACRDVAPELDSDAGYDAIAGHPLVRQRIQAALDRLMRASTGSSTRIVRAFLAVRAPSIDAGEITDKGSLNQRAVLKARAIDVAMLYSDPPAPGVFIASGH